jgi:predicted nucleic acid-binding protein
MNGKCFVDTNILVYAHDQTAGLKHQRAQLLTRNLWNSMDGVLSTQVLQELYVSLRRRLRSPLPTSEVERILLDYFEWEVMVNDRASLVRAIELETRYQISFWDGLMLQAAERSGAGTVYTEDLNHGQRYAGVKVVNPFVQ